MYVDYLRQLDVFDPEKFGETPVHIIGAGATGSWLTLILAKMGVKNLNVYDFDTVESHNLPNQAYRLHSEEGESDIGKLKVNALEDIIRASAGIDIKGENEVVDGSKKLQGVVFVLTDTMSSRKEIFEKAIRYNSQVKLLVETRMGLETGRIYAINPIDPHHVKEYEKTLYSDEEATTSACGASQSIVATAINVASLAAWKLIKFHNEFEMDNEVIVDLQYNNSLNRRF